MALPSLPAGLAVIAVLAASCGDPRPRVPGTSTGAIHDEGILDPGSAGFHGALVGELGWDLATCASCHGEDLGGGEAAPSCRGCHEDGPGACTTCHGSPPATGAHAAHATSPALAKPVACATCHLVPASYEAEGHVLSDDGAGDRAPAELTFAPGAGAEATWDPETRTCANVACHGGALGDPAAARPRPRWDGGPAEATCDACHGSPPASHGTAAACASCHPRVATNDGTLASTALHLDGAIELGDGLGEGCGACHGTTAGGFRGPGAGAHLAHVTAPHRLSGPIPCGTCHVVPSTTMGSGHVDTDLPAEVVFGGVALAGGATPTFDPASGTCADSGCHHAPSPSWTSAPGSGLVFCGSCHGLPPGGPAHLASWGLDLCVSCHAATVDGFGNVLVVGGVSSHMNGIADHDP